MIELKLSISGPEELRVAGEFLIALAEAKERDRAYLREQFGQINSGAIAGHNRAQDNPRWKDVAEQTEAPPEVVSQPAAPEEVAKPAPKRKPKAEAPPKEPEPEVEGEAGMLVQPVEEVPPPPPPPPKGVTLEDIRAVAARLAHINKRPAIKAIFAEYGSINLTGLPVEHYPEILKKLEAELWRR